MMKKNISLKLSSQLKKEQTEKVEISKEKKSSIGDDELQETAKSKKKKKRKKKNRGAELSTSRQTDKPTHKGGCEYILKHLPDFFKELLEPFDSDEEKFMVLLGALTMSGSMLTNYSGIYDHRTLYPNLYYYLVGKAGSGKGNLSSLHFLLDAIKKHAGTVLEQQDTTMEDNDSSSLPVFYKSPIIPGNNSASGVIELLNRNEGQGLIVETEGDTIANVFKTDYGNYSDILRKGFHHEMISYYRKVEDKLIELYEPRVSLMITSTPKQFAKIVKSPEDGLFSRLMFYVTSSNEKFKNVFDNSKVIDVDALFKKQGQKLLNQCLIFAEKQPVTFRYSEKQKQQFLENFQKAKDLIISFASEDLEGSVNRMGCIHFRISMILSAFRYNKENLPNQVVCNDIDFETATYICNLLLENMAKVTKMLPEQQENIKENKAANWFKSLPNRVTRKEAIEKAKTYGIPERSVDRNLRKMMFKKVKHGLYEKCQI